MALSETDIEARIEAYRRSLREEMGLAEPPVRHFKRPEEPPVPIRKGETTVVYCGLPDTLQQVLLGVLEREGYKAQILPTPDNECLSIGKEYCNRGQCNPTYYTIGSLLKFLLDLRKQGMSDSEIERQYAMFWASDCGPCRMGMYEADMRKALKAAGFPNFRIAMIDIAHGLDIDQESAGVRIRPITFWRGGRVAISADLVADIASQVRPYEVRPGETDAVTAEALRRLRIAAREGHSARKTMVGIRKLFNEVEMDYLRVKPRVKVTGEFFLKHAEGESNHLLLKWLEDEGAEVARETIGAWFEYMIWLNELKVLDRLFVKPDEKGMGTANPWLVWLGLRAGKLLAETVYLFYRALMNFKPQPLPVMSKLDKYSEGYYEKRLIAGEGHLEVTKHIYMVKHSKAHMLISVKPFGCMPSTVSDGVQAKVVSDLVDTVFVPIETTGDGEVLVKSRVQMKLQEAKEKAREEMQRVLDSYGVTLDEVRAYARAHPELSMAMRAIPQTKGVVGTAANFAADIARRMGRKRRS
ncbi:MAG: hypothetical protein QME71_10300 [Dehalococcoidia bacterium]|nr:hypothetical protein [Dehalococcoidia bacterium]